MSLEDAVSELRKTILEKHDAFLNTFSKTMKDFRNAVTEIGSKQEAMGPVDIIYPVIGPGEHSTSAGGPYYASTLKVQKFLSRQTRVNLSVTFEDLEDSSETDLWKIVLPAIPEPDLETKITEGVPFNWDVNSNFTFDVFSMGSGFFVDSQGLAVPTFGMFGLDEDNQPALGLSVAKQKGVPVMLFFQFDYVRSKF